MTNAEREVTTFGSIRRMVFEPPLRFAADYELTDPNRHMDDVVDLLMQGTGVLIGWPHSNSRDALVYASYAAELANRVARKTGLQKRIPVFAIVAQHQLDAYKPLFDIASWVFQGRIGSIVIDDTVAISEYSHLMLDQGRSEISKNLADVISQGGLGVMSLLGGRKTSLDTITRVLSVSMLQLRRKHVTNYAVHFAGVSPLETVSPEDYAHLKGWNFGMRYEVKPGNVYLLEDIERRFSLQTDIRNYSQLDAWANDEISALVQPSFRGGR